MIGWLGGGSRDKLIGRLRAALSFVYANADTPMMFHVESSVMWKHIDHSLSASRLLVLNRVPGGASSLNNKDTEDPPPMSYLELIQTISRHLSTHIVKKTLPPEPLICLMFMALTTKRYTPVRHLSCFPFLSPSLPSLLTLFVLYPHSSSVDISVSLQIEW